MSEEFKWMDRTPKMPEINVLNYSILTKVEATRLNKIQRLLVKWFKIPVERAYHYKLSVDCDSATPQVGEVLTDATFIKWKVSMVHRHNKITVFNVVPLVSFIPPTKFVMLYRQFGESSIF